MEQFIAYQTLGKIVKVQQFGALVELIDSNEVGILHISKLSERFISDVEKFLTPGEIIRVDVVKKSKERLELSIIDIPHYRNVDSKMAEEFNVLAQKLPFWIENKRPKRQKKEKV
ncbi:MAG: S1 RNA-binding domain-containing protein [Culicoidibacterales bacterium]